MARHGKATALSIAGLAVAALVGGAVLLRERLAEEWYLRKLRSADEEQVFRAAEMLGNLGSVRAVPEMLGLVARPAREASSMAAPSNNIFFFAADLGDLEAVVPENLPFPVSGGENSGIETPLARLLREATVGRQGRSPTLSYLRGNVSTAFLVSEEDHARLTRTLETIRKVLTSLEAMGEAALPAVEKAAADARLHPATRAFADYYLARRRRGDPTLRLPEGEAEISLLQRTSVAIPGSYGNVYLSISDITRWQAHAWVTLASGQRLVEEHSLAEGDQVTFALGGKDYVLRLKGLRNRLIGMDSATFTIAEKPRG